MGHSAPAFPPPGRPPASVRADGHEDVDETGGGADDGGGGGTEELQADFAGCQVFQRVHQVLEAEGSGDIFAGIFDVHAFAGLAVIEIRDADIEPIGNEGELGGEVGEIGIVAVAARQPGKAAERGQEGFASKSDPVASDRRNGLSEVGIVVFDEFGGHIVAAVLESNVLGSGGDAYFAFVAQGFEEFLDGFEGDDEVDFVALGKGKFPFENGQTAGVGAASISGTFPCRRGNLRNAPSSNPCTPARIPPAPRRICRRPRARPRGPPRRGRA